MSAAAGAATLSVVIPTFEDDAALVSLLERLATLAQAPEEIVVVDGAASAATAALCRARGATWIGSTACRGAQLAQGAARAGGAVLWFLHADADPDPGAAGAIRAAIACGAAGGHFRFRFAGERRAKHRLLEACIAWRCRFGTVYGDQGLFASRLAYERSPGFRAQPLFEEVELVRSLRRSGRFVALPLALRVSTRRWQRDGYWRRTVANRLLALGYACGIAPARLAHWYGRSPARPGPDSNAGTRDAHGERRGMR